MRFFAERHSIVRPANRQRRQNSLKRRCLVASASTTSATISGGCRSALATTPILVDLVRRNPAGDNRKKQPWYETGELRRNYEYQERTLK